MSDSEELNKTYDRKAANKRAFLWFELENSPKDLHKNETSIQSKAKEEKSCGMGWIPLESENSFPHFDEENRPENETKKVKRTAVAYNLVPLGENYVNTAPIDNNFVVPQRLPPKLKKKLTPLKVTPARRVSGGSSSSLRRSTFRVTPRSKAHLNFLALTTTKTGKRRSSGSNSSVFKTPRNRQYLSEAPTPTVLIKNCTNIEDIQYISWINAMLATKVDEKTEKIDSNQLILDCFNSHKTNPSVCPTKEEKSVETYREAFKWNQLRSSANTLYRSAAMMRVNNKIVTDIFNKKYSIRNDRGLHADIGIRKDVLDLLLSYNPLWLRIGLETVFQQKIVITSNNMRLSLGKFIAENLLVSKELMAKYGHKTVSHFFKDQHHVNEAKKYILTKFLLLLNFMDRAKQVRLIEHNPCLFRKSSHNKSTQDLLLAFARDDITGLGDITKHLKSFGFSMGYQQTPIEEFDFEVNNLAVDLRCGIRLARIAELITDKKDLLPQLLYPVTNITRKLHNVEIALKAFKDIVPKGLVAKDIVSGHRKKTFLLLDAIIFKHKEHQILMKEKLFEESVVVIQKIFRRRQQMIAERQHFLKLRHYTVLLQKRFRENKVFRAQRRERIRIEKTVIFVQNKFRANRLMKIERKKFQVFKASTILIQRKFRANRLMKTKKLEFQQLKAVTTRVQRLFRANIQMKIAKQSYSELKKSVIFTQRKLRANRSMKFQRKAFQDLKHSAIVVQRLFRANQLMKMETKSFENMKRSTLSIQRRFRANKAMKNCRQNFQNLKLATICIQRRFRANQLMKTQRNHFQELKRSVICIQKRFREYRDTKRLDHWQQFTGKQLIKLMAEQIFGLKSTSWTLEEEVSYIEFDSRIVDQKLVKLLERLVNKKIRSSISVPLQHFYSNGKLKEIESELELFGEENGTINVSNEDIGKTCGALTSNLFVSQPIKLLYTRKTDQNKTNLYFLCGNRVLSHFNKMME